MLSKIKTALAEALDFQSRLWVVNVFTGDNKGESFVVNEDSFKEPLQWMKRKGYSVIMLEKVDHMQRSQVIEFELETVKHRLMRVK
ncbi:hypothetical protein KP803_06690 [Vibrio sp. ZSDE26]|uniref:Uncharacterized protein n=1 Tax=Vibrio amylolyticus TaxID=2847292 RepID=A0A9X1XJ01_9VIBR|nr:hypothetical protein [Vibrio amylolyticus]MCK6262965.1 hypothetical protein [Vibrio amylolyticus]